MKTKKTNYLNLLKYGILLLIVSLILFNCNTENQFIEQQNNHSKSSIVTLNEIPQNLLSAISEITPKTKSLQKSKSNNLIIINQEQIIKMVDSLHNTNYSINFTIPNSPKNVLYNLILSTDLDNNPKKPFILKYIVHNLEDIRKEDNVLDFSLMKATIKQYSYQNFLSKTSSKTMSRSFNNPCNTFDFNGQNDSDSQLGGDGEGTLDDGNDCDVYVWSNGNTGEIFGITWSCSDGSRGNDYFGKGMDDCDTSSGGIGINGGGSGSDKPSVECPSGKYLNGECVGEDVQIFLDPSFENSFANCAYKLLTENNLLKNILKKLIPKDSKYDVTFKVGNSSGSGGDTSATYGTNGNIIVTINKDLVNTGNVVSISETILHEAVHAKLFEMVKSIGGLDKLNEFTNEDSEIGKLAACYNKYGKPELQHEFIWGNYVKEIAIGTETIHKLFPENYNKFHNYMNGTIGYTKDSFYESVAKAGLNKTSYFKKLDTTEQQTLLLLYGSLKVNGNKLSDYKNCE